MATVARCSRLGKEYTVRKIKVTKKVVAKTPWYEKPPLLFGAIAGLLLVSGVVMAHLNARSGSGGLFGSVAPDSVATAADSAAVPAPAMPTHILTADAVLPSARPGGCLPPLRVETLREAVATRAKLRSARELRPLAEASPGTGGMYAFTRGADLLTSLSAEAGRANLWTRLSLTSEFDPAEQFELQRDEQDHLYIVSLVSLEVGEALGELGAQLQLAEPPPVAAPPKWQFWRKAPVPEKLSLYRGSEITLYPNLSPEATCIVVLPLERIQPLAVEELRLGHGRPVHALQVALK